MDSTLKDFLFSELYYGDNELLIKLTSMFVSDEPEEVHEMADLDDICNRYISYSDLASAIENGDFHTEDDYFRFSDNMCEITSSNDVNDLFEMSEIEDMIEHYDDYYTPEEFCKEYEIGEDDVRGAFADYATEEGYNTEDGKIDEIPFEEIFKYDWDMLAEDYLDKSEDDDE